MAAAPFSGSLSLALSEALATASPAFSITTITLLLGAILLIAILAYLKTRKLAHELREANRAKLEFLTTMSHELRTPLNAIAGYTDLLLLGVRGPVNNDQREDLARIQRNQRQLLALINDVLNFARLDTGGVPYDVEQVRLANSVRSAMQFVQPQLRDKQIQYDTTGLTETLSVIADNDKLYQILVNVLSNAAKFCDTNGRIRLVCTDDTDAGCVHIAISDNGIGIPAHRLQDIFDPFVQVDTSLTREHSGVGLGLSISRILARGMDGDLKVESTVGEGSTFTITLPAVGRLSPSAEAASPGTYRWPDHSTLQAPASQHALAP